MRMLLMNVLPVLSTSGDESLSLVSERNQSVSSKSSAAESYSTSVAHGSQRRGLMSGPRGSASRSSLCNSQSTISCCLTADNRACIESQTPAVYGAAVRLEGQIFVYDPTDATSPCYECLHQHIDDGAMNCAENGVAGPVVGIVGTMQAMEAIRLLCGIGSSTAGIFQNFDARDMKWLQFKVLKRDNCAACSS